MLSIDLNCDMGESTALWQYSMEKDIALLQYISSVNIACGFHAGDPYTMHELVDAALLAGLAIGAHPGFPDKENFGRTNMQLSPVKLYDSIIYQIGALDAFLKIQGAKLHHVKPHGALYNMAAKDAVMANTICKAINEYNAGLILYGLSGSELVHAANSIGLKCYSEVFADRTYRDDGSLTPRTDAHAMIENVEQSVQQVTQMLQHGTVTSTTGKPVKIIAETICIHGDGAQALSFAKTIYAALKQNHIEIKSI
jgi:UPF0271 protein